MKALSEVQIRLGYTRVDVELEREPEPEPEPQVEIVRDSIAIK